MFVFLLFYSGVFPSRVSLLMYLFQPSFRPVFFLFVFPAALSPSMLYLIQERYWLSSSSNRSSACSLCSLDLTHCERWAFRTISLQYVLLSQLETACTSL